MLTQIVVLKKVEIFFSRYVFSQNKAAETTLDGRLTQIGQALLVPST